jgi:hypothetical protein
MKKRQGSQVRIEERKEDRRKEAGQGRHTHIMPARFHTCMCAHLYNAYTTHKLMQMHAVYVYLSLVSRHVWCIYVTVSQKYALWLYTDVQTHHHHHHQNHSNHHTHTIPYYPIIMELTQNIYFPSSGVGIGVQIHETNTRTVAKELRKQHADCKTSS